MSTGNRITYDVRIDDYQRSILASALLTFICEGGFQGRSSHAELEEAQILLHSIERQNLTEGFVNDLLPDS